MPVVNCAADDSVNILAFEEFAEVGITFGAGEVFLSCCQVSGVNIAYGDDFGAESLCIPCITTPLPAAAD